jgi:hypothetical protein
MVEEALLDSVTQSDIESAVESILDGIDIADLLSEDEVLREAVYSAVNETINSVVEAFL